MTLVSKCLCSNARLQAVAVNNPAMFAGETGFAVALVQQALADLGFKLPISIANGHPDGIFGDETFNRIKNFQDAAGLEADGVVGKQTIGTIDDILATDEKGRRSEKWIKFKVNGLPAPGGLPEGAVWVAESYREAVFNVIERNMEHTKVFRAIYAAIQGRVPVRPSKAARSPNAAWVGKEDKLYYTPGTFSPGSKLYNTPRNWLTYAADEVFLHELVHAMRTKTGFQVADQQELKAIRHPPHTVGKRPLDFLAFGKRGEFNAIVLANTYVSEKQPDRPISSSSLDRNQLMLRMDHHDPYISIPLRSPETFHETPEIKELLLKLWDEQPKLCKMVAEAKGQFNPIRDVRKP